MPDVDGIELLRHVRQDESLSSVPVVSKLFSNALIAMLSVLNTHCFCTVMSANEHSDTVFECIRAGAEDYLLKPLTKKEVQYIWQHVWRRKHQPAVRIPPPSGQEQVRSQLPVSITGNISLFLHLKADHLQ